MTRGGSDRTYTSDVRTDQARRTRRRVVDAAVGLFVEHGYAGTTIDAIATAAGVSRKTVFDSVGGKAQLIKLAYDFAIVGDDEPVPLMDRSVIAALNAEPDPAARIAAYTAMVVGIDVRISPIWRVLEGAAGHDAEATALHATLVEQRWTSMQGAARMFAARGELRPELDAEQAAAVLWLANDPSLFDKLVRQRGWSVERFQAWLTELTQVGLLGR